MKSLQFKFGVALLLLFLQVSPSGAATPTKVVKVLNPPILVHADFFQGAGGEWFKTLVSQHSIYLIGTSEPSNGPTQGEVIAIDPATGVQQWDVVLAGSSDSIASAATLDPSGNIWISGSSAPQTTIATPVASPSPTQSNVLNPGGITVDPVPAPRQGLTQLSVWQVSASGTLLNTFTYNAGAVIEPTEIDYSKGLFQIGGRDFHITLSPTGNFTKFIQASFVPTKVLTTQTFKDGLYIWRSFISKGLINGLKGWNPKVPTPIVIKVGSRTGKIYAAYKVTSPLLQVSFLSGVGLVLTTQSDNGYALSLLK